MTEPLSSLSSMFQNQCWYLLSVLICTFVSIVGIFIGRTIVIFSSIILSMESLSMMMMLLVIQSIASSSIAAAIGKSPLP